MQRGALLDRRVRHVRHVLLDLDPGVSTADRATLADLRGDVLLADEEPAFPAGNRRTALERVAGAHAQEEAMAAAVGNGDVFQGVLVAVVDLEADTIALDDVHLGELVAIAPATDVQSFILLASLKSK